MAFDTRHILLNKSVSSGGHDLMRKHWKKAALAGVCLMLAGCINATPLDDLSYAKPTGSAFDKALFQDYSFLAHSFGHIGASAHKVFDYNGSISLNNTENDIAMLANTYASKAVDAANGEFIDPEPAVDVEGHEARDRLLRTLENGRDWFPRDAALAQANYDCWQLNSQIDVQKKAAAQCRTAFESVLKQLETETNAQAAQIKAKQDAAKAASEAARKKAMEDEKKERAQGE